MLLEEAIGCDRVALYLRGGELLPGKAAERFDRLLLRRLSGEPVQHIVGWAPFYGRRFSVGRGVFIPRFDSEALAHRSIEIARDARSRPLEIIDICCGCGVLGLSAVLEIPLARVTLTDNSITALKFAAANAQGFGVGERTALFRWDALTNPPECWLNRFDLALANPPYIPADDVTSLHPDVRDGEPRSALTDEADGLTFYRRWVETLPRMLKPGGALIVEIGDGAASEVMEILRPAFADLTLIPDVSGVDRGVEARAVLKT